jgi:hypothetical protein
MVDWSAPTSEASNKHLLYEIALGLLIATGPAVQLVANRTISLIWFGLGALTTLLAYAGSRISLGHWANKWFAWIGIGGRIIVISAIAFAIWGIIWSFKSPIVLVSSLVVGSISILIATPALRLLRRYSSRERQYPA